MVNSSLPTFANGVLVIPPFEAAWLSGNEYTLRTGAGCLSFEAKGDTDVTIILKSMPGAKRLQPLQLACVQGDGTKGSLAVEQNYTVILGSHRNSCLKFEKNGVTQCMVSDGPCSRVSKDNFTAYYVDYNKGVLTVGIGLPGDGGPFHRWADTAAIPDIQHIGLSCWDRHVSYRNIEVHPPLDFSAANQEEASSAVPSLFDITSVSLVAGLSARNVCDTCAVAEWLLPNTRMLYRRCVDFLASHFSTMASSTALTRLSAALLADVLARNTLAADESMLLTAALRWAQAQVDALEVVAIPTTSPLLEALKGSFAATASSLAELAHTIPLPQAGQSVLFDGVASGSIHPLAGGTSSSSGSKLDHSAQQQAQTDSVARLGRRASQEHQHQHIHLSADMHVHGRGGKEIGTAAPGLEVGQQYGPASAVDAMGSSGLNEDRLPLTPAQHAVHGLEDAGQQANQVATHLARENALAEVDRVMCLIRYYSLPVGVLLSAAEHALLTPSLLPHAAAAVHAALELHQRETGAAAACGTQQPSLLCMQQPSQAVSGGLMLLPSGQSVSAASGSASGAAGMVTGPEVCAQRTHSMGVMSSSVCVGALLSQCSAPLPPIAPTSTSAPRGSLELRRLVCPPSIGQAPGPEGMSGCERVTRGSLGAGGSSIQQPWLVRYQRRAIQHGKELLYVCDGDSNGVLHYLGTQHAQTNQRALQHQAVSSYDSNNASSIQLPSSSSFTNTCPTASSSTIQAIPAPGVNASSASTSSAYAPSAYAFSASATNPASPPSTQGHGSTACPPVWVNPAFTKVVDVRASSPAAPRTTDPKAIVGRQFSRINFAGPRHTGGESSTWWQVDLGQGWRLIANHYTMRHDGSGDFIRSWMLQGSEDACAWVDLKRHSHDTTIKVPGQYASWPVVGPAAASPYRAFRLLLAADNASANPANRRNFPLSNLELYGYLLKQEALSHASEGLAAATTTSTSTRSAHGICHHHEPPLPGNSNNGTGTQPCEADMQSDPVLPADLCCEDTASDGNTTAAVAGPSASSELIVGASSGQGFAYEQVSVPSAY